MTTLIREVSSLEVTDELIELNKKYQKISLLDDKFDELIEAINSVYGLGSKDAQAIALLKPIEKAREKNFKEYVKVFEEVQKHAFLCRMLKGAMALKALK